MEQFDAYWEQLDEREAEAKSIISPRLSAVIRAARDAYNLVLRLTAIAPASMSDRETVFPFIFIKRANDDLRAVWVLVERGYPSEAATVASGAMESALAAAILAGDKNKMDFAEIESNGKHGKLPWPMQKMCALYAAKFCRRVSLPHKREAALARELQVQYETLCLMKHPNLDGLVYGSRAAAAPESPRTWSVTAGPDLRDSSDAIASTAIHLCTATLLLAAQEIVIGFEGRASEDVLKELLDEVGNIMKKSRDAREQIMGNVTSPHFKIEPPPDDGASSGVA